MSDEIDLQLFWAAIRRRWWVVLLGIVLALAIAFVVGATQPQRYQATATLLAQSPRYQWRFDAGILPLVDSRRDYQREFLALSRSNRIAERAAEALRAAGQLPQATAADLAASVSTRAADGSTLQVTATDPDPARAAVLANAWAQAFVAVARQIYSVGEQRAKYEAELALVTERLRTLEKQLEEVRSRTGIYNTGDILDEKEAFSAYQWEIELRNQQLAEYRTDLANLRLLQEQIKAAQPTADLAALPWELLDGPALSRRNIVSSAVARQRLNDRAGLLALLRSEEEALAATEAQLATASAAAKARFAADWKDFTAAITQYNLAKETYGLLSRKVDEASIQERIDPDQLVIISEAVPPSAPVQTRRLALWAVAGVIGLIAGVIAALWLDRALARRPE